MRAGSETPRLQQHLDAHAVREMRLDPRAPAAPHALEHAVVKRVAGIARAVDVPHRDAAVLAVDHSEPVPQGADNPAAALAFLPLIFFQIAVEMLVVADPLVGANTGVRGE